jgi:hypothetical protein
MIGNGFLRVPQFGIQKQFVRYPLLVRIVKINRSLSGVETTHIAFLKVKTECFYF